jgi:hypothetical protein
MYRLLLLAHPSTSALLQKASPPAAKQQTAGAKQSHILHPL